MWIYYLVALLVVVIAGYIVTDRIEKNQPYLVYASDPNGPTCKDCKNWEPDSLDREIFRGSMSGLGACTEPHMVEMYGITKYVILITESGQHCPKWEFRLPEGLPNVTNIEEARKELKP